MAEKEIMTALENARDFIDACEGQLGWAGCERYVVPGASFEAQCEPLVELTTVEAYCDQMASGTAMPGATIEVHTSSYDEQNRTAVFFATYHGKHTGEGGPVPPTHRETHTHYVYVLTMSEDNRVTHMTKVWNPSWTMAELGW